MRQQHRRCLVQIAVALVLVGSGTTSGGVQLAAGTYGGASYRCLVDGPRAPQAEALEDPGVVDGSVVLVPLGRACEWAGADGTGTVTTLSGSWPLTLAALGLVTGGVTVAVAAATRRVHPRRLNR